MVGVVVAMMMSVGGAATVLAVLARRNAPLEGWREALQAGVHVARAKELDAVDEVEDEVADDEVVDDEVGGIDEIFTIADPQPEPAYSEATVVRAYIDRMSPSVIRWTRPAVARVTPAVAKVSPAVHRWTAPARARLEPALDKLRR